MSVIVYFNSETEKHRGRYIPLVRCGDKESAERYCREHGIDLKKIKIRSE